MPSTRITEELQRRRAISVEAPKPIDLILAEEVAEVPLLESVVMHRLAQKGGRGIKKWRRRNFAKFLRKLSNARCYGDIRPFTFVPDLWRISSGRDASGQRLLCVDVLEIEDSSTLSPRKLEAYCDLWFELDCYEIVLHLVVSDRYGENIRELKLQDFFYSFASVRKNPEWRKEA